MSECNCWKVGRVVINSPGIPGITREYWECDSCGRRFTWASERDAAQAEADTQRKRGEAAEGERDAEREAHAHELYGRKQVIDDHWGRVVELRRMCHVRAERIEAAEAERDAALHERDVARAREEAQKNRARGCLDVMKKAERERDEIARRLRLDMGSILANLEEGDYPGAQSLARSHVKGGRHLAGAPTPESELPRTDDANRDKMCGVCFRPSHPFQSCAEAEEYDAKDPT